MSNKNHLFLKMHKQFLNNFNQIEKYAFEEKGIFVNDAGEVFSVSGMVNGWVNYYGYRAVSLKLNNGKQTHVKVHRLQAYQKFGDRIYEKGVCVRHLNGDSLDNSFDNIAIGTHQNNMLDVAANIRSAKAKHASRFAKRAHPIEKVLAIKKDLDNGMTYSQVMKKYDISSKGTISYIKNKYKIKHYDEISVYNCDWTKNDETEEEKNDNLIEK